MAKFVMVSVCLVALIVTGICSSWPRTVWTGRVQVVAVEVQERGESTLTESHAIREFRIKVSGDPWRTWIFKLKQIDLAYYVVNVPAKLVGEPTWHLERDPSNDVTNPILDGIKVGDWVNFGVERRGLFFHWPPTDSGRYHEEMIQAAVR